MHYSIKDLEAITNLKAHTIRIWEARYGLLEPHRTDTNIRYYDDKHLKKLLNVCALMNEGMKISKISQLSEPEIAKAVDQKIKDTISSDLHHETIVHQLLIAVSDFDELLFEKTFSNAILRYGLKDTYVNIIYPLLIRVGLMWSKDDIMPAQEHFLSNLIKQKLFASIDAIPFPWESKQKWLLFLPETESHEIGLLLASYILRASGKKVVYLGQNVPYENLNEVIRKVNPTHLYTFFISNHKTENLKELVKELSEKNKNIILCISGNESILEKIASTKNVVWVKDISALLELTKK